MANDEANHPLLSKLLDPTPKASQEDAPKRRRFRRCRSAPLAEFVPADINANGSTAHSQSVFEKLQIHPSFRKAATFLAIYLGIGALCFYLLRNQITGKKTDGFVDAGYFCIVTMTTAGYGDLVPNSVATKLLVCAFVFAGMALIGLIFSKAADYLVEKQEMLLFKALHVYQKVGQIEILESSKARYKCYVTFTILLMLMAAGTIFLVTVEKLTVIDAFYCVCSTITALGYGDKSFSTMAGRIFAIFWILTGTICLAQFFLSVAELNTESRQRALVDWVLSKRVTTLDLEAADFDDDGVVGPAEFILYKLKEMGKIKQEDISLVMEEFEDLDVDQSGTLTASDIWLAQSTS